MCNETKDLQHTLAMQIRKTNKLLHYHFAHDMKNSGKLSPMSGQGRALKLLSLQSPLSQREIAQLLGIRPQSAGELVGKLEESGYVVREKAENDKRRIEVALTEAGKAEVQKMEEGTEHHIPYFDVLDDTEQQQLSELLEKLIGKLAEGLDKDALCHHGHHGPHGHHGHHHHCH